ncbi:alcohol acetyltransferase [Zychaea mexicana]|uniref:alcohol acetyltransferase n=1 Tax=Zychaea mexicana TaxID=64656 RepID=UPI0022FEFE0C|nr:alcohol acetyltransferase [Zychaea mexicana]KAI9494519.1 alcohol acetyltransferase [Zychaea mexicana]
MSLTTVERPFGLLEKYQVSKYLTRCYGTLAATAVIRHSPRPDKQHDVKQFYLSQLHAPLERLIEKHPQLSLAVAEHDKPSAHFVRLTQFDLSAVVHVIHEQVPFWDRSELAKLIATECDHEFDLNNQTNPLWQLRIGVHDDRLDECSIVFTAQHVIADGKSLAIFWQDLLAEINGTTSSSSSTATARQEEGEEDETYNNEGYVIKPKTLAPIMPPYEDRQSPMPTAGNILGVVSRMLAKKTLPGFLIRRWFPQGWAGDYPAITNKSKAQHDTVVRAIELGGTTWSVVCATSREHKVTPHAAIMAAVVLALAEVYPETTTVSTGTPVNCRSFCKPPVPENEMGNFVGSYSHTWDLPSLSSWGFWDMAKTYHAQLKANKHEAAKDAGLLKYLSKYPEDYTKFWYDHWKSNPIMHRAGGVELSDLGKFVLPPLTTETAVDDLWQIESIWFCQSAQIFTSALSVNSISTMDSMYATVGWQKGSLDVCKADTFVLLVIRHLKNCCPPQ